MSIKRIESAYAYCWDKEMTFLQMAVLQALAYSANGKNKEACFPSQKTLAKLVHTSETSIGTACADLRKLGLIRWDQGGCIGGLNVSNNYEFLFPHTKMPSKRERYQAVVASRGASQGKGEDGQAACPRYQSSLTTMPPSSLPPAPKQLGSNTEEIRNITTKSNSESKSEGFRPVPAEGTLFSMGYQPTIDSMLNDREHVSPVQLAMKVCGVKDVENHRTFSHIIMHKDMGDAFDVIYAFESEIRQGEHHNARNLASILTSRLKRLPDRS